MEEISFDKAFSVFCVKNQLITLDKEMLAEVYLANENGTLELFVESLLYLINNEEVYFYLSEEIVDKVLYIINNIKFDHKEHTDSFNKIIVKMNDIKTIDNEIKTLKIVNYIEYESELRKTYLDLDGFINCINYDAVVAFYLSKDTEVDYAEADLILSSINKFIRLYPEIFKEKAIRSRVENIFAGINKASILKFNLRSYNKETKKEYQKIV